MNSARAFSDALGEFDIIFLIGSRFQQRANENLRQGEQFLGERMQIEAKIEINNPICEQVMIQNFCILHLKDFNRNGLVRLFQVFEFEDR